MAARRRGCHVLVDFGDYDLNFAIGGIAATRELVESEPELVRTFLQGYLDGTRHYKTHKEAGVLVHQKYGGADPDVAAETYDVTHAGFRDFPDPATTGLQRLIDFWKERGKLPAGFSIGDVTDSGPVRSVAPGE
jgi:ABC-type nitrate/sulfonate/bicarbonate transport system substrate-binding protein